MPSVISLLSIVLNVVVLSVIVPNFRADITYLQGQTSVLTTLLQGASSEINIFYSKLDDMTSVFNSTEAQLQDFSDEIQAELTLAQNQSVTVVSNFAQATAAFLVQVNASLTHAQQQAMNIDSRVSTTQREVVSLLNRTSGALTLANVALQQLAVKNASVIAQMNTARDDFVLCIVPGIEANLRALNQSAIVAALALNVSLLSSVDDGIFVGSATGPPLLNDWIVPSGGHPVRFWLDRCQVWLEGELAQQTPGTLPPAGLTMFTLPEGYRPPSTRAYAVESNSAFGELAIAPTGDVTFYWGSSAGVYIDGVSFRIC